MLNTDLPGIRFRDIHLPPAAVPVKMNWGEIYRGSLKTTQERILVYKLIPEKIESTYPGLAKKYIENMLTLTFLETHVLGVHNAKLLGVLQEKDSVYVVSEDLGLNTLEEEFLDRKDRFPNEVILQIAFSIADALKVYSEMKIPHQGVCLDNIFIKNGKWVLGPPRIFQESDIYTVDEKMLDYKSPEVQPNHKRIEISADVWSFGSLVTHLVHHHNKPKLKEDSILLNLGSILFSVASVVDGTKRFLKQKSIQDPAELEDNCLIKKQPKENKEERVPDSAILEYASKCTSKQPELRPSLEAIYSWKVRIFLSDILVPKRTRIP